MNRFVQISTMVIFLAMPLIFSSCKKDDDDEKISGKISYTFNGSNYSFDIDDIGIPNNENGGGLRFNAGNSSTQVVLVIGHYEAGTFSCADETAFISFSAIPYDGGSSINFTPVNSSECTLEIQSVKDLVFSTFGDDKNKGALGELKATFQLTLQDGKKVENGKITASFAK
ncbi:MAG: hypothetical protein JJU02_07590 [Cryomorphaceae bacterium]|nr:hypothetical protein [Cryomorphaceae bacterium]